MLLSRTAELSFRAFYHEAQGPIEPHYLGSNEHDQDYRRGDRQGREIAFGKNLSNYSYVT